jgi:hypothetical protein
LPLSAELVPKRQPLPATELGLILSISAVDIHLMAAVAMIEGAELWTRDKRLMAASVDVGVGLFCA